MRAWSREQWGVAILWALLLIAMAVRPSFGQQVNTDIVPASPGLNLGHQNQRWNGFFNNLNITGTCFINGVPCGAGGGTIAFPISSAHGGTGVANTATLTLGTANINFATLGTGIIKNTTTTGALSIAASADVVALFSGCSGTNYLGADGACHAGGTGTITGSGTAGNIPQLTGGGGTTLTNSVISQFNNLGANISVQPTGIFGLQVQGTYPSTTSCAIGSATIPSSISPGTLGCTELYANPQYPGTISSTAQTAGLFVANSLNTGSIAASYGGIFAVRGNLPVAQKVGVEADVYDTSSGATATKAVGFLAYVNALSTTTTQQAFYGITGVGTSKTITNNYGMFIDTPPIGSSSVLTHNYGLFIADQAAAGSGTNSDPHAIVTSGTAPSTFGGAVTITGNLTTNVTGSTQCLTANSSGVVSGSGSPCGAGGGATFGADLSALSGTTQEVVGILNKTLPALSTGFLNYTGSAWAFSTPTVTINNGTGITGGGTNSTFTLGVTAPVVQTTNANTYTAGQKQTFAANGTNAGLGFAGVTSDPITLAAGDVWFRSDLPFLNWFDGTTTQSLMNQSTLVTDAQLNNGSPATGQLPYRGSSALNWLPIGTSGCFLQVSSGLPAWDSGVCDDGTTINASSRILSIKQIVASGPFTLFSPIPGSNPPPTASTTGLAVFSDGNFHISNNGAAFLGGIVSEPATPCLNAQTLTSNGSSVWSCSSAGTGTVTSITVSAPLSTTQAPITTTATLAISGVTGEQGTGNKLQLSTGTVNSTRIAEFDANGNTVNSDLTEASNVLANSATTQGWTITGGGDASANSILGSISVRGAKETGAGGATSQGGSALFAGGDNAATNTASSAGNIELKAGSSTGATTGLQGLALVVKSYAQGAANTQWDLECFTSTAKTVTDCGATPVNIAGVALSKSGTVQVSVAETPSDIPVNASAAVTIGHTVCAGSTAGQVTDSGSNGPCSTGTTVGTVIATSGAWPAFPDGTAFPTLTTTLPLIRLSNRYQIGTGDLSSSLTLTTPNIGAATGTSLLATGIVDGKAPITITTGTTATLGAGTYNSGYTFNQEATAGTAVTYTLPATATGLQYCVRNSIVSGTGAADTGVLTVYPPASSFVILNGVRNTVGGGGTHGVASGGAAGDSACFVAIDATDWEVFVIRGTWTAN